MNQAIQLSQTQFDTLIKRIAHLEKMVAKLLETNGEPEEGTEAWWKWSDKKAFEDIKKGRSTTVHNVQELMQHLDSLKRS